MKLFNKYKVYIFAFILPILLYFVTLILKGIYPFGQTANIAWDENTQYEQFFNFYYNVLHGNSSIDYSFYKSIGGSLISLWGYYLSSPINLILLFFNDMNVLNFVFLVTSIKIGLCGLTFSIFINHRFKKLKNLHVIMLSIAYSFTQYVVGQMANIMWLDGVYMLPLILYFIEIYFEKNKKLGLYIIFVLTIIFNWYTGYMNCLFAFIYFIYRLICKEHEKNNKLKILSIIKQITKFGFLEILSVLGSAIIFLPVVFAQFGGRIGNQINIFEFNTNGSFLNIFRGFMIGSENPSKTITLFCSILVLILIIYYAFCRKIKPFEKKATLIFFLLMVCSLFFTPLEHIWVGFTYENSFMYRFLYLCILTILLLAATVLNLNVELDKKLLKKIIVICIFAFLIFDLLNQFSPKRLWLQIVILVLYYLLLCTLKNDKFKKYSVFSLFIFEIIVNAYLVVGNSYVVDKNDYLDYSDNEKEMIQQIKNNDKSFYRIETNIDRDIKRNSFISNESLAYSYGTIEQYSSSYDKITGQFLANLGYSRSEFPTFYHEPILPADSLLGVKYLLTDTEYDGFQLKENFKSYNGKYVYENEYVLPLGMITSSDIVDVSYNGNPFEYINYIYSSILGENVQLFTPCDVKTEKVDALNYEFKTKQNDGSNIIYFRFVSVPDKTSFVRDDNSEELYATSWLTHNILSLGADDTEHSLKVKNINRSSYEIQFYSLDLNLFKSVISAIKQNSVTINNITDNKIKFTARGENVLLTIPYDTSWNIMVNGKKVQPRKGVNSLLVIPLTAGINNIEMTYTVRGKTVGLICTVLSILLFVVYCLFDKRKAVKKN